MAVKVCLHCIGSVAPCLFRSGRVDVPNDEIHRCLPSLKRGRPAQEQPCVQHSTPYASIVRWCRLFFGASTRRVTISMSWNCPWRIDEARWRGWLPHKPHACESHGKRDCCAARASVGSGWNSTELYVTQVLPDLVRNRPRESHGASLPALPRGMIAEGTPRAELDLPVSPCAGLGACVSPARRASIRQSNRLWAGLTRKRAILGL